MDTNQKEKLFKEVYTDLGQKISRLCSGYIYEKDEADDLFQEVMINVWTSLDRFRGDSKLSTWVYRVAVNTALLHNRKSKLYKDIKQGLSPDLSIIKQEDSSEIENQKSKDLQTLRYCISKLKNEEKLIVTLLLEGMKYEEIADVIGISLNYVGVKVNRIKKRLFKLMEENKNE